MTNTVLSIPKIIQEGVPMMIKPNKYNYSLERIWDEISKIRQNILLTNQDNAKKNLQFTQQIESIRKNNALINQKTDFIQKEVSQLKNDIAYNTEKMEMKISISKEDLKKTLSHLQKDNKENFIYSRKESKEEFNNVRTPTRDKEFVNLYFQKM